MKVAVPDLITNSYFPALAAVELGFFAAEGLPATAELIHPHTMAALRDGEIAFAGDCAHAVLEAFPGFRGAKVLMALMQGMYWVLVLRADSEVARGDLGALGGMRIGAGPGVDLVFERVLAEAGVSDVEVGPVPGSDDPRASFGVTAAAALESGHIDGFWANRVGAETAVRRGVGRVVLDVRAGEGPQGAVDYTFSALIATDRLIEREPDVVRAAMRAVIRTQRALVADRSLAAEVGRKVFPAAQTDLIADVVARDLPFYEPQVTPETVEGMTRFCRAIGTLADAVPYEQVVATQFSGLWSD